jgi:NADH-quinone oxidoreductase subunit B
MCTAAARADFARFGWEVTRNSPRQADVIFVSGTIVKKMAPVLKRLYDQMAEPKYVIAMGGCASTGGPFQKSYSVVKGVNDVIPVDVYIPGCPPRPDAVLYGMMQLARKIKLENYFSTKRLEVKEIVPLADIARKAKKEKGA